MVVWEPGSVVLGQRCVLREVSWEDGLLLVLGYLSGTGCAMSQGANTRSASKTRGHCVGVGILDVGSSRAQQFARRATFDP